MEERLILTFKRYEKKYIMSAQVYDEFFRRIRDRIEPDLYFSSTVCSVYYDTDNYSMVRHSIENPVYKEKLRLRSYNVPDAGGQVFVEIKKKYEGIVYKRRVSMTAEQADSYINHGAPAPEPCQITKEIDWVVSRYRPQPKAYIACEREAWVAKENSNLRITFDRNLRWRSDRLLLTEGSDGGPILDEGEVLMEIKFPEAAPVWLAELLSELKIFPTSFSKYGTCYKNELIKELINE